MSGVAGSIFKDNTGYLQVGLTSYEIKIIKDKEGGELKLVMFDRRKSKIKKDICVLKKEESPRGKIYFTGVFGIGFGMMEIKIWGIAPEKRKTETSPLMVIMGELQSDDTYQPIGPKDTEILYEEFVFPL